MRLRAGQRELPWNFKITHFDFGQVLPISEPAEMASNKIVCATAKDLKATLRIDQLQVRAALETGQLET